MILALNGLVLQPKKNPQKSTSWKNLNNTGKILFVIIVLMSLLIIIKNSIDEKSRNKEIAEQKEINRHLIKVMSVADGYNVIIRGVAVFNRQRNEQQIRDALKNIFLKYAEINIQAENKLGSYKGKIDYATHPEVRRFLNLQESDRESFYYKYHELLTESRYKYYRPPSFEPLPYFFEIRCSGLKILNNDNIQYARFNENEYINIKAKTFEWSRDFSRIYHIGIVIIDEVEIEELGKYYLRKLLHFY